MVTGGAGYVGSHAVRELLNRGERVVVLDNLSEGHREAVAGAELVVADLTDAADAREKLDSVFQSEQVDVVLHFAGRAYVGESVREPGMYYRHNLSGGLVLLDAVARNHVPAVVFSSTCAIYGEPEAVPILEWYAEFALRVWRHASAPADGSLELVLELLDRRRGWHLLASARPAESTRQQGGEKVAGRIRALDKALGGARTQAMRAVLLARRKALMRAFGSIQNIRDASEEEIAAVPGITLALASVIKADL